MPKLTPPITTKDLKLLEPGDELSDGGCPGLRARRSGSVVMWSVLLYDSQGKRRRLEVGEWPDVGIPKARELARKLKETSASRPAATMTLADVIDAYARTPAGTRPSWTEASRQIRKVFASHLRTRAGELDEPSLQRTADAYRAALSAAAAVRAVKPVLKWAAKRGFVTPGLGRSLEQPQRIKRRERTLTMEELTKLLAALTDHAHDGAAKAMLLTACRREEVARMRFEDIVTTPAGDIWTIPAEVRKNRTELEVPLCQLMQQLIGRQGRTSGYVFLGPKQGRLDNWSRWQVDINTRSGTSGWHRHDLRRTAATMMGDAGIPPHAVEVALGHKDPHTQLAGVYNKSRYAAEHRQALQALNDVVSGILTKLRTS